MSGQEGRRRGAALLLLAGAAGLLAGFLLNELAADRDTAARPGGPNAAGNGRAPGLLIGNVTEQEAAGTAPGLLVRTALSAALVPGATRRLVVFITNPTGHTVTVRSLQATLGGPSDPGCRLAWVSLPPVASLDLVIGAGATASTSLPIRLADTAADQDACQGARIPVTVTVSAPAQGAA
jgi:hypothetical protein